MTERAAEPTGPLLSMPERTPAALRVAVGRIEPGALPVFDQQWDDAMRHARDEYTLTPPRAFVEHWWSWIAVARYPQRLDRFRECERVVRESDDRAERRAAATELAAMLAEAAAA